MNKDTYISQKIQKPKKKQQQQQQQRKNEQNCFIHNIEGNISVK